MKIQLILMFILSLFSTSAMSAVHWRISGFLPSQPTKKVWISVQDGQIACLDIESKKDEIPAPQNCISDANKKIIVKSVSVDTDDYIFSGLMDLHNHIEFNSLPLWKNANGQFKNRFEWRNVEDYQNGPHKFFMRLMKLDKNDPDYEELKDFACLSLQWSEIKALTGGVTLIQGLGRRENEACAKSFGVRNLEIASTVELKDKSISGAFEVINPDSIETGFNVFIRPHLREDMTNYDEAFKVFDEHFKLSQWIQNFKTQEHTIENALRLTIGSVVEKHLKKLSQPLTKEETPDFIRIVLNSESKKLGIEVKEIEGLTKKILGWTFEPKIQNVAYTDITIDNPEIDKLALSFLNPNKFNRTEKEFDAVLHIPKEARDYLVSFEIGILQSLRQKLTKPSMLAYLTHLSEGRRDDSYNAQEYAYAKSLGLMRPNFIPIHGVGFSNSSFIEMAKNKQGLVISPTSNLLLYGESLDAKSAIKSGVNIALGSDWSITGTKTIIDEARVFAQYAKKESAPITQKKLVDMLSLNPSKILKIDNNFGKIALGYQADILVVQNKSKNPLRALLDSKQENVQLVTVKGEPLFGDASVLSTLAAGIGDMNPPEMVDNKIINNPKDCEALIKANKAFRLPSWTNSNHHFSVSEIKSELVKMFKKASARFEKEFSNEGLSLDPIFVCDDADYQKKLNELVYK